MTQFIIKGMLVFFSIGLLASCGNETKNTEKEGALTTADVTKGKDLMIGSCYLCHNPGKNLEQRIAPTLREIKDVYLKDKPAKEDFVDAVVGFMNYPTSDRAKLPEAVEKYGVMPNMSLPKAQVKLIAEYIYDNDIETEEWLTKYFPDNKALQKAPYESGDYAGMGLHFATTTKAQLGKNLMGTIKRKGTLAAMEFCNVRAYPLSDSMALVHDAKIRRVSDKPRNPQNAATDKELQHIQTFKDLLAKGEEIAPILDEKGDFVHFYYPIKTNEMCLQCHGMPEKEIKPDVMNALQELYPSDKAVGYQSNQIRGIWSIEMKK